MACSRRAREHSSLRSPIARHCGPLVAAAVPVVTRRCGPVRARTRAYPQNMDAYIATRPGGRLFFADRPLAVGKTVHAADTPELFIPRPLQAASRVEDVLLIPHITEWPFDVFAVRGAPVSEKSLLGGLYTFEQMEVLARMDPARAFGPSGERLLRLFERMDAITAESLFPCQSVEDAWFEQKDVATPANQSPCRLALQRAKDAAPPNGLSFAFCQARRDAERLALQTYHYLTEFCVVDAAPFRLDLLSAFDMAALGAVVAHLLPDHDVELLTTDLYRITGIRA